MDDRTFDDLAKVVGSETQRRTVLKTIAGGALGVVLASVGSSGALAGTKQRAFGNVCSKDADCLAGVCLPSGTRGRSTCACPAPLIACGQSNCLKGRGQACANDQECCGNICDQGTCQSCFVGGTRVAMADGTSRAIEDVLVGDFVLGSNGQANRVIGVETPKLGSRSLYAFNGGSMFVTAEHPFSTESGWKAVDPAATARENSSLPVGRLEIGDRLMTLAAVRVLAYAGGVSGSEPADIRMESMALTQLDAGYGAPDTQLFNLLLDGDHAYFANDYLVHNKN